MSLAPLITERGRCRWTRCVHADVVARIALIAIAVAACFVGFGVPRLWSVHTAAATLRPSLETGIAAAAIVGVILLVARFRQTRLLRDLLLLTAFAAVALTDFVFHALPAYDLRTSGYGAEQGSR